MDGDTPGCRDYVSVNSRFRGNDVTFGSDSELSPYDPQLYPIAERSHDIPASSTLPAAEIAALVKGKHGDPFAVLGIHPGDEGLLARALVPGAETVEALTLKGKPAGSLARIDKA